MQCQCLTAVVCSTDGPEFQESFVTSGVFSVTELVQVSRSKSTSPLDCAQPFTNCHHSLLYQCLIYESEHVTSSDNSRRLYDAEMAIWGLKTLCIDNITLVWYIRAFRKLRVSYIVVIMTWMLTWTLFKSQNLSGLWGFTFLLPTWRIWELFFFKNAKWFCGENKTRYMHKAPDHWCPYRPFCLSL